MEASLPISAAVKPTPAPAKTAFGPNATAPSVALPLRFMITGLIALAAGVVWLVAEPVVLSTYHYNQHVIALTHLFVLGWLATIVMGAMYQLVPVALETHLYSERLAKWQFLFHVVGFVGMVLMFRVWNMKNVGHFGSVLGIGVALFIYNIVRTLLRVPKWSVVASAVASSLGWIALAVLAGLSIAAAKIGFDSETTPSNVLVQFVSNLGTAVRRFDPISAMHAHAHLGAIGFFVMLIVGVSYKLIPMFTLSEVQNKARARASVILLNVGLLGSFVCILAKNPLKFVFSLVVLGALATYGWELIAILRARKRGPLDWGIRHFLTAIVLLLLVSLLAVVLSWPWLPLNALTGQLENLYGFLGLIGVISFAVMGMLYKIIPFLVWFGTYSRQIGKMKVPALAEMYSARLQAIGYYAFLAGLIVTGTAIVLANSILVRVGCGLIAASVTTLLLNIGNILSHYFRPRLTPFVVAATARKAL
jgi:hypothetical protein